MKKCRRLDAYASGHLVLSHFGTCICSYVETNLSWTCLVSGLRLSNIPRYFYFYVILTMQYQGLPFNDKWSNSCFIFHVKYIWNIKKNQMSCTDLSKSIAIWLIRRWGLYDGTHPNLLRGGKALVLAPSDCWFELLQSLDLGSLQNGRSIAYSDALIYFDILFSIPYIFVEWFL